MDCGLGKEMDSTRKVEENPIISSMGYSVFDLVLNEMKQALVQTGINCLCKSGPLYSTHLKCKCPQMVLTFCRGEILLSFSYVFFLNSLLIFPKGPRLLKRIITNIILYNTFYSALFECYNYVLSKNIV